MSSTVKALAMTPPATPNLRPSLDVDFLPQPGEQWQLLELWVNGQTHRNIVHISRRDGQLWISQQDIEDAGISVAPSSVDSNGMIAITQLDGVRTNIDEAGQRLLLSVDDKYLHPQVFDLRSSKEEITQSAGTGLIVGYDALATTNDLEHPGKTASLVGALNTTLFSPYGSLTNRGFTRLENDVAKTIRLDTTIEIDKSEKLQRWLIGDLISGGLSWSRPVRIGGLQWATDFSLQPEFISYPLPQFYGQAEVPATVDVYVNSTKVFQNEVAPGPFELHNLPVLTGNGDVQVVTRDVLGRETVQTIPLYVSTSLLREGLWSYAFDAGALRHGYGQQNFGYGKFASTATVRYGWTPSLTVESHVEAAQDLQAIGGGATFGFGSFGAASLNLSASQSQGATGMRYGATFESRSRPVSLFGSIGVSTGQYRDLASIEGASGQRLRLQLGGNATIGKNGSFAVSWLKFKNDKAISQQLTTASYTYSLRPGWTLGATGLYNHSDNSWVAELSLTIPLGDDMLGNIGGHSSSTLNEVRAAAIKSVNPDGGFGYRLSQTLGGDEITEGGATWYGRQGNVDAALSSRDGIVASQIVASGGLVYMDGSLFATQRPDGSVALVKTGRENVRVKRENRDVAISDSDGQTLLTHLVPYARNLVSVDIHDYPLGTVVNTSEKVVSPPRQSGIIVDLAPPVSRPVLMTLLLPGGATPPVGARVTITGLENSLIVGRSGQVFISDLPHRADGVLDLPEGQCLFEIEPAAEENEIAHVGPIYCRMGEEHA